MDLLNTLAAATAAGAVAAGAGLAVGLKKRSMDRWLPDYVASAGRRGDPAPGSDVHALICIADHYEPLAGDASPDQAQARVDAWVEKYPRLFGGFKDSDGRPPRHSFFFPIEMYVPEHLDGLAELCGQGFGEVEIHLHHDHDTEANLRRRLLEAKQVFSERHGLLSRDPATGELVYGFIHGNWALDNARPDGRWCGVNNELDILRETGCYADFTLPSAPSATQTRTINSIYYAVDDPRRPKSHDQGTPVGSGPQPDRSLMIVQGPLLLDWTRRKFGLIPFVENACIQGNQAPTAHRLDLWLRARVQVPTRPDWYFIKLHTHGGPESNQKVLLGDPMVRFHDALACRADEDPRFHYHYVTAREMYNLVRCAESGRREVQICEGRELGLHSCNPMTSRPEGISAPTPLS